MKAASRTLTLVLIVAALGSMVGCGTAAKEGADLFLGADGTFVTIRAAQSTRSFFLADYTQFEVGGLTDDTGGNLPPYFMSDLRVKFAHELAEEALPNYAGKTLVLRGTILHYEAQELVGKIIGPIEQVIVRAEMVDKASGQVLTTANVVGRTTSRVTLGAEKKAEGLARGFVAWIKEYRPDAD
jgi:hypothetical protein